MTETNRTEPGKDEYRADVALISVTDIETAAVHLFHDWKELSVQGDEQTYETAVFTRGGKEHTLVHARAEAMGMTAAAVVSAKLIHRFRPRYLILVGIAAGIARSEYEEQLYGDVIVPDIVWNYAAGKFVSPDLTDIGFGSLGFLPRPAEERISAEILECVRKAAADPENECHVYIGPMACGSSVVANPVIQEQLIHSQVEHTAGLDMESYGVVYTANHATVPAPRPIVIKSVCDYADSRKSDEYQKFAAYTSCQFARFLYERYLPL